MAHYPPLDVLRELIIDRHLSYEQVAQEIGRGNRKQVYQTFRAKTLKAGLPWPWPQMNRQETTRRLTSGMQGMLIDGLFVREAIRDAVRQDMASDTPKGRAVMFQEIATTANVHVDTVRQIHNGDRRHTRIKKPVALRLLRALGEDPHPTLVAWVQTKSKAAA